MPLDSVCEPVAAFPKELTGDLTFGWPSVIPDATRPDVERFPYPVEIFRAIRGHAAKLHRLFLSGNHVKLLSPSNPRYVTGALEGLVGAPISDCPSR
jgi:hypothetical protein